MRAVQTVASPKYAGVLSLSRSRCTACACLRPVTPSGFQVDQRGFSRNWDVLQVYPSCTCHHGSGPFWCRLRHRKVAASSLAAVPAGVEYIGQLIAVHEPAFRGNRPKLSSHGNSFLAFCLADCCSSTREVASVHHCCHGLCAPLLYRFLSDGRRRRARWCSGSARLLGDGCPSRG